MTCKVMYMVTEMKPDMKNMTCTLVSYCVFYVFTYIPSQRAIGEPKSKFSQGFEILEIVNVCVTVAFSSCS
jgi:hypothetical protein